MAQLMPLPLAVSCFSKIQIGFTSLVLAHPVSPDVYACEHVDFEQPAEADEACWGFVTDHCGSK